MISSPASSSGRKPGGPYRKPRADLYTVLLALALIAILLGIVCLYFENDTYDWDYTGGPTVSILSPAAFAPAPSPLTPLLSTDAPTTLPLFQL
jgi:hypothetical protein